MNWVTLLGLAAGILVTTAAVPQAMKIWKTHQTSDISLLMYINLTVGIFLWLVYGILLKDLPITLTNGVSLLLVVSILALKIKYG